MGKEINATGSACPKPVMMTKKALDTDNDIEVLVDNETAAKNVAMFASSRGYKVSSAQERPNLFRVHIEKQEGVELCDDIAAFTSGPTVFVFSSNVMGRGDDALGAVLIKAFIHTATEMDRLPDVMVFFNTGVKLVASDAETSADIRSLEERGVKILVCGTCVNFFNLSGKLAAGTVSNMYDILNTMNSAGRIINP
jgi:selenium metabolism protein YedF